MKKIYLHIIITIFLIISAFTSAYAAITGVSVSIPPGNGPTTVSTGDDYYLASSLYATYAYEFEVTINDPAAATRDFYDYVDLEIELGGGNIITARWVAPAVAGNPGTFNLQAGDFGSSDIETAVTGTNVSGTTTLVLTFQITFAWDIGLPSNGNPAIRTITATAFDDAPSSGTGSTTDNYGFCNRVKILNLAQDGEAADGMIHPHAANFNVTGNIAYNIGGATDTVPAADISAVQLWQDTNNDGVSDSNTTLPNGGALPAISFTVDPGPAIFALGTTYWRCPVILNNPDASTTTLDSSNSLPCTFDRVQVTGMVITNPANAGRDDGNTHWRSTLVPGTSMTLNAQLQNAGTGMQGNTDFTISNGSNTFTITINNGSNSSTVVIPSAAPDMISESASDTYTITNITGSSYGTQTGDAQIRDAVNYPVAYYADQTAWWDDSDAPNGGVALNPPTTGAATAAGVTIYWDPMDTRTTSADGDFYEYRLYIRETAGTPPWNQWDGDDDTLLRDAPPAAVTDNPYPSTNTALHFTNPGGQKYTTITGLDIFTEYEYYVTAVDIFGNETPAPGANETFRTTPYSIEATVSDGPTQITNDVFASQLSPAGYAGRQLKLANIKVTLRIVTTEEETPDTVRVWYTDNPHDGGDIDIVVGSSANTGAFASPPYLESANALRITPNDWVAYLPTTSPIIQAGNSVRFVVETRKGATSSFSDLDMSELPIPLNNNNEWSFSIIDPPNFKPWPVRILNNVLTDKNPVCYPSYYLTDDAFVTITAYDIKGRPVATIIDNAFRRGGQNIKDQGWRGVNKARRKLGVGLYYIHIKAERASDGKVILNKFKKVVVAR